LCVSVDVSTRIPFGDHERVYDPLPLEPIDGVPTELVTVDAHEDASVMD
jgi:hypothetical protein